MDRLFDRVLVRPPGKDYSRCLSKNPDKETIDVPEAKAQHEKYVNKLKECGLEIEETPPLKNYPDAVFVQDTALVGAESNRAVICRFGVSDRRGEEESVARYLKGSGFETHRIEAPGTLEGGDVLVTDSDKVFVGESERTNVEGIEQLSQAFPNKEIIKVPVSEVFHLLSTVNYLGENTLAVCPDIVDTTHFQDFELIKIKKNEQSTEYPNKPINLMYLGKNRVMLPNVYPETINILQKEGYSTIEVDISEFWKGDAGTTCPTLPFYKGL